jgi:hypothetical protein
MRQILSLLLLTLTLLLVSYRTNQDLEKEKYLNYIAAIENESTFSYFTVVKVKDLNTGMIKEICTEGNFIIGALHIELNQGYSKKGEDIVLAFAKTKKDRYFEFKKKKALKNISFFDYNPNLLDTIQAKYDFDEVVRKIKENKKFSIELPDEIMKLYAHVLFNRGYMTGENDCFGGKLIYVDRKKSEY